MTLSLCENDSVEDVLGYAFDIFGANAKHLLHYFVYTEREHKKKKSRVVSAYSSLA